MREKGGWVMERAGLSSGFGEAKTGLEEVTGDSEAIKSSFAGLGLSLRVAETRHAFPIGGCEKGPRRGMMGDRY